MTMIRDGWSRVENGAVIGYAPALPSVLGNISGFDKVDDATALGHGFYPRFVDRPATVQAWQTVVDQAPLIQDDRVVIAGSVVDADLATMKADARAKIDIRAEQSRLRFITDGAGQAMVYRQKVEEAEACVNDPEPTANLYPHLAAEVGVTADDMPAVAEAVLSQAEQWRGVSAQIEGVRLAGKKAVADAVDHAAVLAAIAAVSFPGEASE